MQIGINMRCNSEPELPRVAVRMCVVRMFLFYVRN